MSRAVLQRRNESKWGPADDRNTIHAVTSGLGGVGTGAVTDANAPIFCDATQVALIDEIHFSCITKDSAANTTVTLQINGRTSGVHGATSTRTADALPFHFPGDANLVRADRFTLRPRGRMVVHPSSTLWVQASDAGAVNCHIRYRKKNILAAYRDGDISTNGTLPQCASTNSATSGGTGASTAKNIIFAGTVLLSGGVADAGGDATHLVDAALTQADDFWNGKKVRFTSGANNGLVRGITDFVAATDTITFAPAVAAAVGAGDTYEILDTDEAIEILAIYLTGHNFQAAATDDIRLGFWDNVTGANFPAGAKMIFRGYTRGLNSRYGMRLLLDNVDRCVGGALGSDVWIEATANLAGATPKADYNIIYRRVKATQVSDTGGAAGQTPVSQSKWWCMTETDPGVAQFLAFFNTAFAIIPTPTTVRIKGYANSVVSTAAATGAVTAIAVDPGTVAITDPEFLADDGNGASCTNTWGRDGISQDVALSTQPGFSTVDVGNVFTSRASLAWGTFGSTVVSAPTIGIIV